MNPVISFLPLRARSLLAALIALAPAPGHAAEAPSFTELLHQSLAQAPAMAAQAATVRAAGADAAQARAWPNPRIDTVFENLGAPASDGVSQRQDTFTLTQPFELGGKRGARIEAGQRSLLAAEARQQQVQVAFAAELAVVYASAEAALARKAVATENLTRANEELSAARALVQSGKEATLRISQAQASVAAARAAGAAAANEATQVLARLSAMAGSTEPYTSVTSSLLSMQAMAPRDAVPSQAAPSVVAAEAERNALDAQVDVERKRWIPDVGVSAGVRRYGWTNASGYVVGVSASIPLLDRNRYGVNAAVERAAAAQARLDNARLEAAAARRSALSQVETAELQLAAASEGEQAAAEAYRVGRIGYDSGKTPLVELLAVRRALLDARQLTIDARLARVRALATLAQADGRLAFEEAPR